MASQIFISYSKKDRAFAWRLADDLVRAGHKVWIDRSLQVGEDWEQTIESNLAEADEVIVILSSNAIASKWVQHEGSIGYGLKKRMYPVLIQALPAEDLPLWVSKYQYHSFVGVKYEDAFRALHNVLTPPNPIQDLLDQQVVAYQQTGELLGDAILRVIEENRPKLKISSEAAQLIQNSQQSRQRAYLKQQRTNRNLIALSLVATAFAITSLLFGLQSRQQAKVSLARSLSSQAKVNCDDASDDLRMRCLLLSIESYSQARTTEAMDNLRVGTTGLVNYHYFSGYADPIRTSAFSPDGRYFATGSKSGLVLVTELDSGKEIAHLQYGASVTALAFSPDGRFFASGSGDATTHVVELTSGNVVANVVHDNAIIDIRFSPNARYVAIDSANNNVKVLELNNWREVLPPQIYISTMVFSTSEDTLVMISGSGMLRLINLNTGQESGHMQLENLVAYRISADGQYFASISSEGLARVIDLNTWEEVVQIQYDKTANAILLSPGGHYFAVGHEDGTTRVVESSSGAELLQYKYPVTINALAFSVDERFFAAGSGDGIAHIVDLSSRTEIVQLQHYNYTASIIFSLDSKYVATISDDGIARIVNLTSKKEVARLGHDHPQVTIAFSPDSRYFSTRDDAGLARVVDLSQTFDPSYIQDDQPVNTILFSPKGQYLAIRNRESQVRVIDIRSGKPLEFKQVDKYIWNMLFSPNERLLAIRNNTGIIRVVELGSGKEIYQLQGDSPYILTQSFSPDSRYIAIGRGLEVDIVDLKTGTYAARFPPSDKQGSTLLSQDWRYLATGTIDGTVRVTELNSGKEIVHLQDTSSVQTLRFSPDGLYFASASNDGMVHVIDLQNGDEILRMKNDGALYDIYFTADSRHIFTRSSTQEPQLLEISSGKDLGLWNDSLPTWVSSSLDGRYIASGRADNTIHIVDLKSRKNAIVIQHDDYLGPTTFSPDGDYFASGSGDNTVRVVELSTGEEIAHLEYSSYVSTVVFSPDGRYIATGGGEKGAWLLLYRPQDLVTNACNKTQRNLSLKDWYRFVGEDIPYHVTCPGKYIPQDAVNMLNVIKERQQKYIFGLKAGGIALGLVVVILTVLRRRKKVVANLRS